MHTPGLSGKTSRRRQSSVAQYGSKSLSCKRQGGRRQVHGQGSSDRPPEVGYFSGHFTAYALDSTGRVRIDGLWPIGYRWTLLSPAGISTLDGRCEVKSRGVTAVLARLSSSRLTASLDQPKDGIDPPRFPDLRKPGTALLRAPESRPKQRPATRSSGLLQRASGCR